MSERPRKFRLTGEQKTQVADAVRSGIPWSEVRLAFSPLPPEYLDSHWFDWARRRAGLPAMPLPSFDPPPEPVITEEPAPKRRKKNP